MGIRTFRCLISRQCLRRRMPARCWSEEGSRCSHAWWGTVCWNPFGPRGRGALEASCLHWMRAGRCASGLRARIRCTCWLSESPSTVCWVSHSFRPLLIDSVLNSQCRSGLCDHTMLELLTVFSFQSL